MAEALDISSSSNLEHRPVQLCGLVGHRSREQAPATGDACCVPLLRGVLPVATSAHPRSAADAERQGCQQRSGTGV